MENKYHYNYFNSINEGLNNSIYYLKNVKSEPELFFDTINNILKTLKTKVLRSHKQIFLTLSQRFFDTHSSATPVACLAILH